MPMPCLTSSSGCAGIHHRVSCIQFMLVFSDEVREWSWSQVNSPLFHLGPNRCCYTTIKQPHRLKHHTLLLLEWKRHETECCWSLYNKIRPGVILYVGFGSPAKSWQELRWPTAHTNLELHIQIQITSVAKRNIVNHIQVFRYWASIT